MKEQSSPAAKEEINFFFSSMKKPDYFGKSEVVHLFMNKNIT